MQIYTFGKTALAAGNSATLILDGHALDFLG
jgi:hypothetical protein